MSVSVISAPGYQQKKVSKSINGSNASLQNAQTYHPGPVGLVGSFNTSRPSEAKALLLEKFSGGRKGDWIQAENAVVLKEAKHICATVENLNVCVGCKKNTGMLICCDGCIRSYHLSCCGLNRVPSGDWFCGNCDTEVSPRLIRMSLEFKTVSARNT